MHELGIAQSVFDIVSDEAARHPGARVRTVGLTVGRYSGVEPDSLRFCFDCLKQDTPAAGAELRITAAEADELDVSFLELEEP